MPRLFVAAWPPEAVRARLAMLPRPTTAGLRWVPDRDLHVTLRYVGNASIDDVAAPLREAELPRVTARLHPRVEWLDRRHLVVGVEGVDLLAASVRAATSDLGVHDPRPYRGHLTLARARPGTPLPTMGVELSDVIPTEFVIEEVALAVSDPLPTGAAYTVVETFTTNPSLGGAR